MNKASVPSILFGAMLLVGLAQAQPERPGNGGASSAAQGPERPSAAELMGKTGGSLLKASILASSDPGKAKPSARYAG